MKPSDFHVKSFNQFYLEQQGRYNSISIYLRSVQSANTRILQWAS